MSPKIPSTIAPKYIHNLQPTETFSDDLGAIVSEREQLTVVGSFTIRNFFKFKGALRVIGTKDPNPGANTTTTVCLGASMSKGSLFRLKDDKAYLVKSNSSEMPIVDGIILEGGSKGSMVKAGMVKGAEYWVTGLSGRGHFWLSTSGTLTSSKPTNYWSVYIGHRDSLGKFVFRPETPVDIRDI